jgi:hypothetical protein
VNNFFKVYTECSIIIEKIDGFEVDGADLVKNSIEKCFKIYN